MAVRNRITPAYAGNTDCFYMYRDRVWDHPRLRGEHFDEEKRTIHIQGSPPPTRGTRKIPVIQFVAVGITPAYAGNTNTNNIAQHTNEDHPRLRGEHATVKENAYPFLGSPPHTRGTQKRTGTGRTIYRITPAYAGNT